MSVWVEYGGPALKPELNAAPTHIYDWKWVTVTASVCVSVCLGGGGLLPPAGMTEGKIYAAFGKQNRKVKWNHVDIILILEAY